VGPSQFSVILIPNVKPSLSADGHAQSTLAEHADRVVVRTPVAEGPFVSAGRYSEPVWSIK
jgi:hypothetical protein